MFHKSAGHLVTVGIEVCAVEAGFLLFRDKVIKQHRSQLCPELINISGSEALRPTSPSTSIIGMTKPYNDMYTHLHFTGFEKEHSDYLQDQPRMVDMLPLVTYTIKYY